MFSNLGKLSIACGHCDNAKLWFLVGGVSKIIWVFKNLLES